MKGWAVYVSRRLVAWFASELDAEEYVRLNYSGVSGVEIEQLHIIEQGT